MGFLNDLETGQIAQEHVKLFLEFAGFECSFCNKTAYDIAFSKQSLRLTGEVKFDIYAYKSGNIAIEYFNPKSNKASGLTATEADYWFHVLSDATKKPVEIWVCGVVELRNWVNINKPLRFIGKGGDGNANLMLYTKEHIQPLFTILTMKNVKKYFKNGKD